jgi:hypothetical protein
VRERQGTAGNEGFGQAADDLAGLVGIGQEVQDREHQHGDGFAEIDEAPGALENLPGIAQVGLDHRHPRRSAFHPRLGVADDDMVVVHVHNAGIRGGGLRYLVHVFLGGQTGADVEELADSRVRQDPHDPGEELPVLPARQRTAGYFPQ